MKTDGDDFDDDFSLIDRVCFTAYCISATIGSTVIWVFTAWWWALMNTAALSTPIIVGVLQLLKEHKRKKRNHATEV